MESKRLFTSIAPALCDVQREIGVQADLIVDSWGKNGRQSRYINRIVHHLLDKPGKMLRPALVLLSAGMSGWDPSRQIGEPTESLVNLAAAVELIHSASLIHDDIIDEERMRRGRSTLHREHGNQTAVLVGDILYAQSFSLITSLKTPRWDRHLAIYRLYCDTTRNMCLGEIIEQRILAEDRSVDLAEYLDILKNKTAILMSACCRSGAILAEADEASTRELADFGMAFGLAFQLLDDHRDNDALISGSVKLVEEALQQMDRARWCLNALPQSVFRQELLRACDFVIDAVQVAQR